MSQQVFTGRYEIVRHLARGGMAEVYLARDLLLDRPVALKVLFPEFSGNQSFVERFRREARAAANLNHPNIVSIYDWGEEEGTYFIVMEYIDGLTLREVIRADGRLAPLRAAAIGADIAAALDFAHRGGVVHRDVKPGNVLISGLVKVTDFGIARANDPQESLTQTGAVMGTATYFSPEQAQGVTIDARSDVYSLGVVLYEMVSGRPPFTGESPVAIAYQHVREAPVPLSQLDPDIPPQLEAVIAKAMAKNRGDRYSTAEELRADLVRFGRGQQVQAAAVGAAGDVTGVMTAAGVAGAGAATGVMGATQVQPRLGDDGTQVMARTGVIAAPVEPDRPRRTGVYFVLLVVLLGLLAAFLVLLARQLGVGGGSSAIVPQVVGFSETDAIRELSNAGLKAKSTAVNNDTNAAGTVFAQDPAPNAKVKKNSTVAIKVSLGPTPVDVPDVRNTKVDKAQDTLIAKGFQVDVVTQANDSVAPDTVFDQDPKPGGQAPKGSKVTIVTSSGPQQAPVPNVVGRDQSDAANVLGQAGFVTSVQTQPSDTVAQGKVIRTDPASPTPLAKGATVTLVVSSGPAATTTSTPAVTTTKLPSSSTTTTRP
ncbi:MAG TPA: Stk1 family PASTA domain-containing Ser/Thr kinase [Acidimicrobiales bacterium]|jgi:serine/threonine-protein kinase|nr:Stk1 family PASTA domain-containing Ser/Thr kinase [Acidimicrobiales bacterium]